MVLALRDELPAALLASTPRLVILNAWTLLYAGRLAEAEDCIGQLARFLPMPSASRQRVLLAEDDAEVGDLVGLRRGDVTAVRGEPGVLHQEERVAVGA